MAVVSHNKRINLTVRPVTRLACLFLTWDSHGRAQGARPSRPAGYARRSADDGGAHASRFDPHKNNRSA